MTTHLRKVAENKRSVSSDILGKGAQPDVPNASWEIHFHLAGCGSNQQERTPSTKCQRRGHWVTTWIHQPDSLIGNPFQSVTTLEMLNKCNGYLKKWSHVSLISTVKSKMSNWAITLWHKSLCLGPFTDYMKPNTPARAHSIASSRPNLCGAVECVESRWSAMCLFTSQSVHSAPHHSQASLPVPAPSPSHLP